MRTHGKRVSRWMWAALVAAFPWTGATAAPPAESSAAQLPDVPEGLTSFGAAIAGDAVYLYGGHTGRAHEYYRDAQSNLLRRLDLKHPERGWKTVSEGPRLQGLAMVADRGKLYRLGGFTARNPDGEPQDLWSQSGAAAFDVATGKWSDLPPLPEPRSSFDAAVLDARIYVIGGWQLRGHQDDAVWHQSAHSLDLTQPELEWQSLPAPPFQRRALSVAAFDGKLFALGGMQPSGKTTTRVDIFDTETQEWSRGPDLIGEPLEGFGSAAFATGGRLFASTIHGKLQRLSSDGKSWEVVKQLERERFFHRMLPVSDSEFLFVGGASMTSGKFLEVELIRTP